MRKPSTPAPDGAFTATAPAFSHDDLDAIGRAVAEHLSIQIADGLLTAAEAKTNAVALAGDDTLLSESEAAEILATRRGTLAHWRQIGHGPRIVKISPNRLAYRLGDLRSFIESAARGPKVRP